MNSLTISSLESQDFFRGFSKRHLEMLLQDAMLVNFKEGESIFFEGDPANRFFLITSGEVILESSADKLADLPNTVAIETLGAGKVLGWSWLYPPCLWHFDARAITPVEAFFFYGTRLRVQCENDYELGYQLMKRISEVVIDRLQVTRQRLMEESAAALVAS